MDAESEQILTHLILTQRTAALGTLRDGWPFVSLVLFAPADDFTAFYIHVSRLAHHTQDLLQDRRAGLMIAQTDDGMGNPQTFARLSILGEAFELSAGDSDFSTARTAYLAKYPEASPNFSMSDFSLFRITVHRARYVAGFGKIYNLVPEDFRQLALKRK